MLRYLGLIENPILHERVRRWLTSSFGCTVTRCVGDLVEAQSLFITNTKIGVVITDLPPGKLLQNRFDEIHGFVGNEVRIIIINPGTSDIFVPSGKRAFTIVPEGRLENALNKVLHLH